VLVMTMWMPSRTGGSVPRTVDGILLLDKPEGLSSNAALQQVKRLYQARKAGHTGSLDPLASGLLPICLGEATKVSGILLEAVKGYRFACRLGVTTSTGDAEGEILAERPADGVSMADIQVVLPRFRGEIQQVPPMYSALKIGGQRLYDLARRGVTVEREPRRVVIYELTVVAYQPPLLTLEVRCSKGTYVRSLAEDIGEALGCGAHVAMLRRTLAQPFGVDNALTLDALRNRADAGAALDVLLLSVDTALRQWPSLVVAAGPARRLCNGQSVPVQAAAGQVRLYSDAEEFLGIGEVEPDGGLSLRRRIRVGGAGGAPPT